MDDENEQKGQDDELPPSKELEGQPQESEKKEDDSFKSKLSIARSVLKQAHADIQLLLAKDVIVGEVPALDPDQFISNIYKLFESTEAPDATTLLQQTHRLTIQGEPIVRRSEAIQDELEKEVDNITDQIHTIEQERRKYEQKGTLGRATGFLRYKRLTKEVQGLVERMKAARESLQKARSTASWQQVKLEEVKRVHHGVLQHYITTQLDKARVAYSDWIDEGVQGKPSQEVRQILIDEDINKKVEELIASGNWNEQMKEKFFTLFYKALADEEKKPGNPYETSEKELLAREIYSKYGFTDQVNFFIRNKQDKKFLERILTHIAYLELDAQENELQKLLPSDYYEWSGATLANKGVLTALLPEQPQDSKKRIFYPMEALTPPYSTHLDLDLWDVVKRSPTIQDSLSEEIATLDKNIEEKYLDLSLTDSFGTYIDGLTHFPSPTGIKNLVLIAAADFGAYRTTHANSTLNKLAKRPDWPQLLNAALTEYPELAKAYDTLLTWNMRDTASNYNGIQEITDSFVYSIYSTSENKKEIALAEAGLNTTFLLQILESKGDVTKSEMESLLKAISLLKEKVDDVNGYSSFHTNFRKVIRQTLLQVLRANPDEDVDVNLKAYTNKLVFLSEEIARQQENKQVLEYLASYPVLRKIGDEQLTEEDRNLLLRAYEFAPVLLTRTEYSKDVELLDLFVQFASENRLRLLNKIPELVPRFLPEKEVNENIKFAFLHGEKLILDESDLTFWNTFLFLENSNWSEQTDISMGKRLLELRKSQEISDEDLVESIPRLRLHYIQQNISPMLEGGITRDNWQHLLLAFIATEMGERYFALDQSQLTRLTELFQNTHTKDFCLEQYYTIWKAYINQPDIEAIPFTMLQFSEYINAMEGAGPLKHIEALSEFSHALKNAFISETIKPQTVGEMKTKLSNLEERFNRERWSYEDRTNFYNISSTLVEAAPSLYTNFLDIVPLLGASDLKQFANDVLPLLHAQLTLLQQVDENSIVSYDPKDLVRLRQEFSLVATKIQATGTTNVSEQFKDVKERILETIKSNFKERFGVLKIPDNLDEKSVRTIQNSIRYLSNIANRDPQKELILSFYLGLQLNDEWAAFREGQNIDLSSYFGSPKLEILQSIIAERDKLIQTLFTDLGVEEVKMPRFQKLLQLDSEEVAIGHVQTIDERLTSVIDGVNDLLDEDIYQTTFEKDMLKFFRMYQSRSTNAVLAKSYQQIEGKPVELTPEEQRIQDQLKKILEENGRTWSKEGIKSVQDDTKHIGLVMTLVDYISATQAEQSIVELKQRLDPPPDVITVFNKLGEDFNPGSGAFALSVDLEYLENAIAKNQATLSKDEQGILVAHLESIRSQMQVLEKTFKDIQNKFENLKQTKHIAPDTLLRERIEALNQVMYAKNTEQQIRTVMSHDMNIIIENIRGCLGALRKEVNNDTDLTFGDSNKFFITSYGVDKKKSIADEIVFLLPSTSPSGEKGLTFVMDLFYGLKNMDITMNHTAVVVKKLRMLKTEFPEAHLNILLSQKAMESAGVNGEFVLNQLQQANGISCEQIDAMPVTIHPSAVADHYTEFSGWGRGNGDRLAGGILITI